VNPLDPDAIAAAMRWVLEHPQEAAAMGKRGREAVLARYNWESEFQVLLKLYRDVQAAFPDHRSVR
jgi:glycosyltransferase involved in cell wall biosynthesis